jgi:hypothetical protein
MEQEYLEAQEYTKDGKTYYKIKGNVHPEITNLNGRNKIIKNGRKTRIDVKLIEHKGVKVFKVTEY